MLYRKSLEESRGMAIWGKYYPALIYYLREVKERISYCYMDDMHEVSYYLYGPGREPRLATKDVVVPMGRSNTRIYGHRTRILKRLPQELVLLLGENDLHGDVKDMYAHPLDYLERMIKSVESLHDGYIV